MCEDKQEKLVFYAASGLQGRKPSSPEGHLKLGFLDGNLLKQRLWVFPVAPFVAQL